jgi:hypothetical protein
VLYAQNATLPVVPASNAKPPVSGLPRLASAPASASGPRCFGAGTRTGSTWNGDLFLKGHGDPTLATSDVARLGPPSAVRASRG